MHDYILNIKCELKCMQQLMHDTRYNRDYLIFQLFDFTAKSSVYSDDFVQNLDEKGKNSRLLL